MSSTSQRLQAALDFSQALLESHSTRLVLSLLIIVSVLPEKAQEALFPDAVVGRLDPIFLAVFSIELLARLAIGARRWQERQARRSEVVMLVLDVLAVISFLPLDRMIGSSYFRLVRLARLLLLFGYWGRMARDLLAVLSGPDRRYQVIGVLFLGLVLSFGSAVVITHLVPEHDFDGNGVTDDEDRRFFHILWWSFRQVQDTGNLVSGIDHPRIVVISLLLTIVGMFLFSLVIGIGTGAIEEVLARSREQPLALREHTVVLGLTPHSVFLLEGLANIYRKNLTSFRAAVLGPTPDPPAYLHRPSMRTFQYRSGDPVRAADLDRVNIQKARRVLILGADPHNPDGEVISAILATRERNPRVDVYPDIEHERNFRAVLSAGGPGTHLVGSGSFLGQYIVANVVYPGIYEVYRQLLTSTGSEIYTYFFSREERERLPRGEGGPGFDPATLHRLAYRRFGVTPIGFFLGAGEGDEDLEVLLNPTRAARGAGGRRSSNDPPNSVFDGDGKVRWPAIRGLAGISLRWAEIRRLGQQLAESPVIDGRPRARGDAFQSLDLRPASSRIERVLISGASLRVPRVVAGLTGFYPRLDVTVLVGDRSGMRAISQGLRDALAGALGGAPEESHDGDRLELRFETSERRVRVVLLETDWAHRERLDQAGAVDLDSADAVLLLPAGSRAEEHDGTMALDCLHLANLERSGELRGRPGLHVVGVVRDAVKGDLLESRLAEIAGPGSAIRFSVISSERVRHHFIMQNVFVRGLNPLYLQLLNAGGQHLSRLIPREDAVLDGAFDPAELGEHLLLDRGLVFVGLELTDENGGYHIELDPQQMPPGRPIPWRSVRAIYALGSWSDLCQRSAPR
ncbi:MAG: hypothetical protein GY719_14605 [bacterium]|nr:hypothetical protein [bacterium]